MPFEQPKAIVTRSLGNQSRLICFFSGESDCFPHLLIPANFLYNRSWCEGNISPEIPLITTFSDCDFFYSFTKCTNNDFSEPSKWLFLLQNQYLKTHCKNCKWFQELSFDRVAAISVFWFKNKLSTVLYFVFVIVFFVESVVALSLVVGCCICYLYWGCRYFCPCYRCPVVVIREGFISFPF